MIDVMAADITTLDVEAIVNAASRALRGGGGVDGAIHDAAGPEMEKASRALGPIETGSAVVTPGDVQCIAFPAISGGRPRISVEAGGGDRDARDAETRGGVRANHRVRVRRGNGAVVPADARGGGLVPERSTRGASY